MALWRASVVSEDWLEDIAAKGIIPPNEVAGWRAPLAENELPVLEVEQIASFMAFHERGLGYPAHASCVGSFTTGRSSSNISTPIAFCI